MSSVRFWEKLLASTLPALVVAVGLFPPHVIPALFAPLALAALLVVLGLGGSGRLGAPRADVVLPLIAVSFLAALSTMMALQPLIAARTIAAWFVAAIVFTAARSIPGQAEARRLGACLVLLAVGLGSLGLYQSFVAFPNAARVSISPGSQGSQDFEGNERAEAKPSSPSSEIEQARLRSGRAVSTLGFPAALASLLILGIPLAVANALAATGISRAAWGIGALIQALALGATRSIGALAALAISSLICLPLWPGVPRSRRLLFAFGILLAGGIVAAPRLVSAGEGSGLLSFTQRAANWKAGLSMIASHPILGVGPGNYGIAFPLHRTWASNETQHAHNSYLEAISDLGVPVAPFLLLFGFALLAWVRNAEEDPESLPGGTRAFHRALSLGCLAWSAQNFFDFTAYLAATAIPFAAAAGLLARSAHRSRRAAAAPSRAGIATRSLLTAAALLVAALSLPDALSRIHLEGAVGSATRADFEPAVIYARRAARVNAFDPEARVVLSQSLIDAALHRPASDTARAGLLEEALVEAEEAVRLDPWTANRRAALAMARAAVGDAAGAYGAMRGAFLLNPFKPSYAAERDRLLVMLTGTTGAGGGSASGGVR